MNVSSKREAAADSVTAESTPPPIKKRRKMQQLAVDRWYAILGFWMAAAVAGGTFALFGYVCFLVASARYDTAMALQPYLTPLVSAVAGVAIGALFTRARG